MLWKAFSLVRVSGRSDFAGFVGDSRGGNSGSMGRSSSIRSDDGGVDA